MDAILFFGVDTNLCDSQESSKQGMVGKEYIVEVDFAGLRVINKVAIGVVDSIKQEAS